jgi:2-polyprenyl-3-methyl-5-hydroxy-6-metoxy-1,4-benzoquinol methylase
MDGLGTMHAASFATDPKHLGFVLARYKFVAKMLTDQRHVLEVGCGDGTGGRLVKAAVWCLTGVDAILDFAIRSAAAFPIAQHDMVSGPFLRPGGLMELAPFDAAYALDVLEHVQPEDEGQFLSNVVASIKPGGVFIVGSPSLESQPYASELSRRHHCNCKTEDGLRTTLKKHFANVFLFGMQDETLTTGFGPMCHYRLAICTSHP